MTAADRDLDDENEPDWEEIERREKRYEPLLAHISLHGPLQVRTIDLRYEPGDYIAWNGVKGGGPRGYGWDSRGIPSQYLLLALGPEGEVEVRIDRVFKQTIGRLSQKRRNLIKRTMPATVTLVKGDDPWYGRDQILVSSEELALWVKEVEANLEGGGKSARPAARAS